MTTSSSDFDAYEEERQRSAAEAERERLEDNAAAEAERALDHTEAEGIRSTDREAADARLHQSRSEFDPESTDED